MVNWITNFGSFSFQGPAHYGFQYGVHDPHHGANFGHQEERDGYVTRGGHPSNVIGKEKNFMTRSL